MELTLKQEEGLKETLRRYKNHEKYVTISGYAGTGKSTLVRFIIAALGIEEEKIAYATFTGKAAEVLRRKGNKNAMTLHKLLYEFYPKRDGGFIKKPKLELEYDIVVVDECSMVPKSMIDMLLAHKIFVIFLGDPGQLPMIDKTESHDLLQHPHVFLDQIMRQAAESEIIRLTMKIRNGESIPFMKGKEVMVIPRKELVTGHLTWGDIVITATNANRHAFNKQIRELKGKKGLIEDGDKLLIKRNYWNDCNDDGDALVNGTIGTIHNVFETFARIPRFIKADDHNIPIVAGEFIPEIGSSFGNIDFDKTFLDKEQPFLDWRASYQLSRTKYANLNPRQATYGYAITCHSAQGSQWSKVVVIEENFPFDREEHKRWVYTGCTRPEEKLVLVRD